MGSHRRCIDQRSTRVKQCVRRPLTVLFARPGASPGSPQGTRDRLGKCRPSGLREEDLDGAGAVGGQEGPRLRMAAEVTGTSERLAGGREERGQALNQR